MDDEDVPGTAPRPDQLLEEASLWFARMRGPDAEMFRPAFEKWLSLGAAHLGAYNRAGEVFALGKFLAETPDDQTIDERNRVEPWINRPTVAVAASILLLLGVGAWVGRNYIAAQVANRSEMAGKPANAAPDFERVSADGGVQRNLTLADGSKVVLEPGSVLATMFDSQRRELRLERGRARFDVAHEKRSFIVLAGGGSVTARGTIFDVEIDRDRGVTVYLLRGAVDVARPTKTADMAAAAPIVTRLAPGEILNFGATSTLSLAGGTSMGLPVAAPRSAGAGEVVEFEKASLSQIVAQANKDATVSIRLADPAIGDLKVSGRFRIDDPEQVANRLASLFNLKVARVSSDEILLQAR